MRYSGQLGEFLAACTFRAGIPLSLLLLCGNELLIGTENYVIVFGTLPARMDLLSLPFVFPSGERNLRWRPLGCCHCDGHSHIQGISCHFLDIKFSTLGH